MKFKILTLFPEIYDSLKHSIIGKAIENGKIELEVINIRDYSKNKHRKCDDYPFGGGAGMLMTPQPLHDCIMHHDPDHDYLRIYLSPQGSLLTQKLARSLSKKENIMLINGAYEGVDQRIIDMHVDLEISIGDYVLTCGDYASIVLINVISRCVDEVLGGLQSLEEESFEEGLLEYPQYTRPAIFQGMKVPEVLLSGDHEKIAQWRKEQRIEATRRKRPDLIDRS